MTFEASTKKNVEMKVHNKIKWRMRRCHKCIQIKYKCARICQSTIFKYIASECALLRMVYVCKCTNAHMSQSTVYFFILFYPYFLAIFFFTSFLSLSPFTFTNASYATTTAPWHPLESSFEFILSQQTAVMYTCADIFHKCSLVALMVRVLHD